MIEYIAGTIWIAGMAWLWKRATRGTFHDLCRYNPRYSMDDWQQRWDNYTLEETRKRVNNKQERLS